MISSIKVQNIRGVSFEMHFANERDANNSIVKDECLFRTFQLRTEDRKDLRRLFLPLNLLKIISDPDTFANYCNAIKEGPMSVIDIEYFVFDADSSKYERWHYHVAFDKYGIEREKVNEKEVSRFSLDPYESAIPLLTKEYFDSIMSFDMNVPLSLDEMLRMAKSSIKSAPFKKFAKKFIEELGYESLSSIETVTGDSELYFRFDDINTNMSLDSSNDNFKHLFAISVIAFLRPIIPGVVLINNIDSKLTDAQVYSLLEFINTTAIDRPMQLVIGSDRKYNLFPEQEVSLTKKQNLFICEWQNY